MLVYSKHKIPLYLDTKAKPQNKKSSLVPAIVRYTSRRGYAFAPMLTLNKETFPSPRSNHGWMTHCPCQQQLPNSLYSILFLETHLHPPESEKVRMRFIPYHIDEKQTSFRSFDTVMDELEEKGQELRSNFKFFLFLHFANTLPTKWEKI